MHEFEIGGVSYANPRLDTSGEFDYRDEQTTLLRDLGLKKGSSFLYRYDFGDDWEHLIVVEEVASHKRGMRLPRCTGGARARPPEDVGGVDGYERFLAAIADPADERHEEILEWAGGSFDPEGFDLEATDREMRRRARAKRGGEQPVAPEEGGDEPAWLLLVPAPAVPLGKDLAPACEAIVLRRNVVATIEYLRDNRVTGTQSRGNFPRKAVEEIASRFVDPPRLEQKIGDKVYRFHSEDEVRPIYFVHALAHSARLVTGGPAQRWKLTPDGERFLRATPIEQAWAVFAAWWYRIDWLVVVPRVAEGEELPESFPLAALEALRAAHVGESVAFTPFAEGVLEAAGWEHAGEIDELQWRCLTRVVEQGVIEPLEEFALLEGGADGREAPMGRVQDADGLQGHPPWGGVSRSAHIRGPAGARP